MRALPGVVLMGLSALAFSLMAVAIKILKRDLPAAEIVFFRGLLCIGFTVAAMRGSRALMLGRRRGLLVVRGLVGFCGLFLYTLALGRVPLPDAMALQYTHPIFAALAAWLLLSEKMPPRSAWAMALSAAGALVILNPTGDGDLVGNLIGLGSGVASALAYTAVRALARTESPLTIMLSFHVIACLCATGLMLGGDFVWPTGETWIWILAVAVVSQAGQWFLTLGLQKEKAGVATTVSYSAIAFGALWAAVFFGEPIRMAVVLGTILMVFGLTWIGRLRGAEKRAEAATSRP